MSDQEKAKLNRRDLLKGTGAAALAGTAAVHTGEAGPADKDGKRQASLIERENAKEGTLDWQLTRVRVNDGKYRTSLIEGYASRQSVAAGETITFHVSTKPARRFLLDLYRLGYYGGKGGRQLATIGPLQGKTQSVPEIGERRIRECRWEPSHQLTIPNDWPSGVYLGKLTTVPDSPSEPYWQSYVIFVVRDNRPAEVVFQVSDNTWQAYNRWPANESLYTDPRGAHAPGVAVSFDRPYGKYVQIYDHPLSIGSGEYLLWEYPLSYWLERHGYDVTYVSNADTIEAATISRGKVFLSVGHDEYWDPRQFHATKAAINTGTSVLWLCGNSVFIDSPFEGSTSGREKRIISRRGCFGELRDEELESYRRLFDTLEGTAPDEREIMGVRSVVPFNGGGDWTCRHPDHWVFEGTGMKRGESIPGLVGWEHHGEPDLSIPHLEVLAEGPIWSGGTREGKYTSVIFPGPKGNIVFNASTIWWPQGLASPPGHILPWSHWSRPHGPDERVERMTRNLLARALG
ncbi:hypothetical protein Pan216_52310 [Planctomycetes bacterium Pan216]|uniref:N,N-dimethylformamidase beta subunit-like C-terminal domain-containing protein n=1 Tax=Kolteria novifilia TaxID=2527975 RepID=A0A518BBH5_9BACT|nr:hypothetical protein Pan216_52310 [Planctomycetes bacterium Pan216]